MPLIVPQGPTYKFTVDEADALLRKHGYDGPHHAYAKHTLATSDTHLPVWLYLHGGDEGHRAFLFIIDSDHAYIAGLITNDEAHGSDTTKSYFDGGGPR